MAHLKIELERHLHQAGVVLLGWIYLAEAGAGGVRVWSQKARVIERVVGLEAVLQADLLPETEVLRDHQVEVIDPAGADVAPAGRIGADEVREVLIDTVLDRVAWRGLVIIARQILNAGPCRVGRNIRIL